jgi:nucleoside-diphosphate-sugar epimerase
VNKLPKIAVVGANGFVGIRLVEWLHLSGRAHVVPVVRRVNALASLARFDLDWRIADACDPKALGAALVDCDYVVHTMVGDPPAIVTAARALAEAAVAAKIKRIVYLSTASVHGQNPSSGSDENSSLSDAQEIPYNNAKVCAERILFRTTQNNSVGTIALRPSIVFGPRDRWVSELALELLEHRAWLINKGQGICNTIYVDNLIHAIDQALIAPASATGRPYLVTDSETITWREFAEMLSVQLEIPANGIHHIATPQFPSTRWADLIGKLRASSFAQGLLTHTPGQLKNAVKGMIKGWQPSPSSNPWATPSAKLPSPTLERVRLQQCQWRFPSEQARLHLNYSPPVSFSTGLERTVAWLRWSGQIPTPAS